MTSFPEGWQEMVLSPEQAKRKIKEAVKDYQQHQSNHQSAHHAEPMIDLSRRRLSGEEEDSRLQFKPSHAKSEKQGKSWYR